MDSEERIRAEGGQREPVCWAQVTTISSVSLLMDDHQNLYLSRPRCVSLQSGKNGVKSAPIEGPEGQG